MRRAFRRLFTFSAAVSLVLCTASVVLWVRSYEVADDISFGRLTAAYFTSSRGGVLLTVVDWRRSSTGRAPPTAGSVRYTRRVPWTGTDLSPVAGTTRDWRAAGFIFQTGVPVRPPPDPRGGAVVTYVAPKWSVRVPYWSISCATLAVPSLWLAARLRQHRRSRAGLCPACGYDLRATPDRCPECGRVPSK